MKIREHNYMGKEKGVAHNQQTGESSHRCKTARQPFLLKLQVSPEGKQCLQPKRV